MVLRYIFESKETKQATGSKKKEVKSSKRENFTQEKVIAHVQVGSFPCNCICNQTLLWVKNSYTTDIVQECGPCFAMQLIGLQHGTFDTKSGEYEWVREVLLYVKLS